MGLESLKKQLYQLQKIKVKNLIFTDDTFNIPLLRFKKICRMMIDEKFKFDWFSYFRCASADKETFDLMMESGCKGVFLGIESGDEQVLKNMNKGVKPEQYLRGIQELNKRGIATFASFVVGFPGETSLSVENTINLIKEAKPTFFNPKLYYHYQHSPVHMKAKEFGLAGRGYSWKHHTMNWREALDMQNLMLESVKESAYAPTRSFDFWSFPYLLGQGFSYKHFSEFLNASKSLMLKSFMNERSDTSAEEINLHSVASAW